MKVIIAVLISVSPLVSICFRGDSAYAEETALTPHNCDQIRAVRRIAIKEDLDAQTLATLEYRYCAANQQTTLVEKATPDCLDLKVMTRLMKMAATDFNDIRSVDTRRLVACGLQELPTEDSPSSSWFNGVTAKLGSSWYYPNGVTAKLGSSWYYPNGVTARLGSSWYYPNGVTARLGNSWYYPNGNSASTESLLTWACSIVRQNECKTRLSEIRNSNNFWRDLAILELSWKAYKQRNS